MGGRCAAIEADGFRFDVGPTFFLYPRILKEIFASTGYDLFDEVPMRRLDPQYRIAFGAGGQIDATPDIARMEQQIAAICPQDAASFQRFMDDNRNKLARFRPILESPFQQRARFVPPVDTQGRSLTPPLAIGGLRAGALLFRSSLKIAFSFQSKYLGMSPFRCPSLFSILAFLEYEHGVFHPIGGCSAVSERMADIARDLGVEIHLDEPVERILFSGKKAVGVHTSLDEYGTDALVINADFARSMHRLVPDTLRPRWTNRRLEKKKFSCSTFMMYLGIEGRYDDLPHHTIHIAADYDQNLADIERRHVLSEDPSFYVQNACVTDPTLAPDGMSTLYVLVPVTQMHKNVDWSIERERFRQLTIRQLEKIGMRGRAGPDSLRTDLHAGGLGCRSPNPFGSDLQSGP